MAYAASIGASNLLAVSSIAHNDFLEVAGLFFIIKGSINVTNIFIDGKPGSSNLATTVVDWVPALGFSCGMDWLTTSVIAGRLIFLHRRQRGIVGRKTYLSLATIMIESALLSSVAKLIQLFVPGVKTYSYAVIPICVRPPWIASELLFSLLHF
jgi:hypothetical protein